MDFAQIINDCAPNVAPQTMAAIIKTESQYQPYAIGINGTVTLQRQPKTKEEAVSTANWLLERGYNIDLGLGQVNSANLPKIGLSVKDAFDPCKNVAASAAILQNNYERASKTQTDKQAALGAALSAYNTGSFSKGYQNGYVEKVAANANTDSKVPAINPQAVSPIPLKGAVQAKGTQENPPKKNSEKEMVYGSAKENPTQSIMVY